MVTTRVARLRLCTRPLLESLVGSWTSVFLLRRRCLCFFQVVFSALRSSSGDEVIRLSADIIDELWTFVLVAPLCVADLRAQALEAVFATDASDTHIAAVQGDLPPGFMHTRCRKALGLVSWLRLKHGCGPAGSCPKKMSSPHPL